VRATFTDINFEEQVVKTSSGVPVLVDFHAEWCGPCKMMDPILEELATQYEGKIVIGGLDVDANNVTSTKFGVMSIPTLIFFKNGMPVKQSVGYQDKAALQKQFDEILAS